VAAATGWSIASGLVPHVTSTGPAVAATQLIVSWAPSADRTTSASLIGRTAGAVVGGTSVVVGAGVVVGSAAGGARVVDSSPAVVVESGAAVTVVGEGSVAFPSSPPQAAAINAVATSPPASRRRGRPAAGWRR
jgi:hypothetical protein